VECGSMNRILLRYDNIVTWRHLIAFQRPFSSIVIVSVMAASSSYGNAYSYVELHYDADAIRNRILKILEEDSEIEKFDGVGHYTGVECYHVIKKDQHAISG